MVAALRFKDNSVEEVIFARGYSDHDGNSLAELYTRQNKYCLEEYSDGEINFCKYKVTKNKEGYFCEVLEDLGEMPSFIMFGQYIRG